MSETSDERSPGFNRSLIKKLVAAGVFVVLGTIGVAYYMNYCRDCREREIAALDDANVKIEEPTDNPQDEGGSSSKTLALKPVSEQKPPQLNQPPVVAPQTTNSFSAAPKQKTSGGSFKPSTSSDSKSGLPPSKSFSMPKVVAPQSDFPPTNPSTSPRSSGQFAPASQKKPIQNENAGQSISNRFQQLKQSSNQFANKTLQNAKDATQNFAQKTSNTLRNTGGARNQQSPVPRQTQSFQPPINSNPQNSAAPVVPRASFDTSRDLKPFAAQKSSPPPIQTRPTTPVTQGSSNRSTIRNTLPPISTSPRQSPIRNPSQGNPSQPPRGLTSNNRLQNRPPVLASTSGNQSTPVRIATSNQPGDRKLEGMQAPSVTIEKIAPREIQVNQPADFQLVVKNVGKIAANHVRVFDQIPSGTELVQSVPQPRRDANGKISWELDTLAPGQEKRIKLQLLPRTPGEIGSVAQVTFSAMASMRTKVTKPVLAIQHSTEPKVLIGDKVVLNIDVKNEGDGPATDVIIQEDLPEGLAFSEGYRELEYAVGTLGPGQSKKVRLELQAAKIGRYRNVLVAHAGGGLKTQHAVDLEVIAPALQATGDGPTRRFIKRKATHRFSVRNSGTASATNVELICRLPSGLRYVSANNRGKYDENSHAVYWSLAELNSGLTANVELTTDPIEPGNQDLKFEANSDLDQSAKAICKLNVEHLVDIFFDIDDLVDTIEIGSDTTYKLRIVNQGTKTATNILLQVDFPSGIQPTAVEGKISNEIRGQQIVFQPITSLNPGDEIEIMIRGRGITAGDHRVAVNLSVDGREVKVAKQESTRVYSDR